METFLMYVWGSLIVLLCHLILTFIVMEFAVDYSQPKTPVGELRINTKGFIIKKIYKGNIWRNRPLIPKNICQLFRGVFTGIIWFILFMVVMTIVCAIAAILRIMQIPAAFILGYLPIFPKGNFMDILFDDIDRFKPYQCYGEYNEKKWIAPWKIIVPAAMLIYHEITWKAAVVSVEFAYHLLITKTAMYIGIAIILVIVLIIAIALISNYVRKTKIGTVTKEFFKSLKDRVCLRLVPVDSSDDTN